MPGKEFTVEAEIAIHCPNETYIRLKIPIYVHKWIEQEAGYIYSTTYDFDGIADYIIEMEPDSTIHKARVVKFDTLSSKNQDRLYDMLHQWVSDNYKGRRG